MGCFWACPYGLPILALYGTNVGSSYGLSQKGPRLVPHSQRTCIFETYIIRLKLWPVPKQAHIGMPILAPYAWYGTYVGNPCGVTQKGPWWVPHNSTGRKMKGITGAWWAVLNVIFRLFLICIKCDIQIILFHFKEMFHINIKMWMCTIITYTWVPYGQTHVLTRLCRS